MLFEFRFFWMNLFKLELNLREESIVISSDVEFFLIVNKLSENNYTEANDDKSLS